MPSEIPITKTMSVDSMQIDDPEMKPKLENSLSKTKSLEMESSSMQIDDPPEQKAEKRMNTRTLADFNKIDKIGEGTSTRKDQLDQLL